METQPLIGKMKEYVQDFRMQIAKGGLASIPPRNTETFFRELVQELPDCCSNRRDVELFAACVDRFGAACAREDVKTAARTLMEMENVVESVQSPHNTATEYYY